jgi:hypothetical protein
MTPRRSKPAAAPTLKPFVTAFDADRHVYTIDGIVAPSVTQVLNEERFVDFSMIPNGILSDAQARGTYVHQVLHAYLEDDYDVDDCDPRYRGYVDSAIAYLAELKKTPLRDADGKPIAVEYRFWHTRRWFAGTIDYVGFDGDGALSIDDWKTGSPDDVAAPIQTAAYECGIRDCLIPSIGYDGPVRRRAVKLHRDGRPGTPAPYFDPRDLMVFFAALSCVHFRRNRCQHGSRDV